MMTPIRTRRQLAYFIGALIFFLAVLVILMHYFQD
jgi:hypothetical protein